MRPPRWLAPAAAAAALVAGCAQTPEATQAAAATPDAPASAASPASAPAPSPAPAPAPTPAPSPAPASPPASGPAATPAAAPAPAAAATPPPPGQLPPFALVLRDARATVGLVTAWQKDERVWLELEPGDFDKPFFLSPKLSRGLGENWFYGGLMLGSPRLVQWRRVHNTVQLMALNTQQYATANTPEGRAVAAAMAPSLLASVPVLSQPHPQRKSVLIDASGIFVNDMLGIVQALQRTYRQGYGLEGRNSLISGLRGSDGLSVFEVTAHYATGSLSVATPGAPPGAPVPSVPGGLADPRSMLLGLHFSLARLPAQPMARRAADPRVGFFHSTVDDFSDDLPRSPRQRFINRWRLEKKDPAAALSEPVKPITYWIDRNVPLKYRDTIRAGILEWNKAFERIGFKNAIVVEQQPDDADWDTLDADRASVRWMTNREAAFGAIGPTHVDPRSGEILDADIGIESLSSRSVRALRSGVLGPAHPDGLAASPQDWAALMQLPVQATSPGRTAAGPDLGHPHDASCQHGALAGEQLQLGLEVLAARGELAPDSPEAQQFVLDYLKDVTMHELGHTLGLRHNFRASHAFSDQQVSSPAFTHTQAFSGSVMDYAPINLPRPGEAPPAAFSSTLGPYDYWAIEYAYKPIAPADEAAELARIAARSGEPGLGYGTDEDNFLGVDPDALQLDLGSDPLAFASRRLDIAADLYRRQETRQLRPDEDYASLRRGLLYATRDVARSVGILLRQVGGLRTLRDYANTGHDPLQAVPAATQRAALALVAQRVLAPGSLEISPALQRRLAPDYLERAEGVAGMGTEFALADGVRNLQRAVLIQLMSDVTARRVLDNQAQAAPGSDVLRLGELYDTVDQALWRELPGTARAPAARRNLQREHVNLLALLVTRPMALGRADARGLLRSHTQQLLARLQQAQQRPTLDPELRRHLQDSADTLRQALAATMERATP